MEHLLHFSFIFGGAFLGLVIWFLDSFKNKSLISQKSLVILTLLVFSVLHVSPLELLASHHHQAQDHTSYHPCCMPQTADVPMPMIVFAPVTHARTRTITYILTILSPITSNLKNKSPPAFV